MMNYCWLTVVIACLSGCQANHPNVENQVAAKAAVERNPPVSAMAKSAVALTEGLNADQLAKMQMPFDSDERFNWNYVPLERKGLTIEEMNQDQRALAMKLLRTGLSDQGMEKAQAIMQLENVLRELEGRGSDDHYRHPERYYLSLFGDPAGEAPWGWRLEGHHLSLNFSSVTGEVTATPAFFGSNPATLPRGNYPGNDVLRQEEEKGRALLMSFNEAQRKSAIIAEKAPGDIITGNNRKVSLENREGLGYPGMTPLQQAGLVELIKVYLNNMEPGIAAKQWAQILEDGVENLKFAWAGGSEKGQGHYYRIQGPGILIEYDNTQNDANHIHTVWRDLRNDFGEDLLKRHYETSPHHHNH